MSFTTIPTAILATASAPAASGGGNFFFELMPLLLIFVAFYFLLIRPQQKRMKTHQTRIAAVVRGDTVVTGGGIVGKVTKADDDYLTVEIAKGTSVKVVRATLSDVVTPVNTPAND